MYVCYAAVPLGTGKQVKAVTSLDGTFLQPYWRIRGVHVFAIGSGG